MRYKMQNALPKKESHKLFFPELFRFFSNGFLAIFSTDSKSASTYALFTTQNEFF
jgi:hypothetical protein